MDELSTHGQIRAILRSIAGCARVDVFTRAQFEHTVDGEIYLTTIYLDTRDRNACRRYHCHVVTSGHNRQNVYKAQSGWLPTLDEAIRSALRLAQIID